jgi:hypothetical protein
MGIQDLSQNYADMNDQEKYQLFLDVIGWPGINEIFGIDIDGNIAATIGTGSVLGMKLA